jgi:hypothetical protein
MGIFDSILGGLGDGADWTNDNVLGGLFTTDIGAGGKPVPGDAIGSTPISMALPSVTAPDGSAIGVPSYSLTATMPAYAGGGGMGQPIPSNGGMFGLGPQTWGQKLGTLALLGIHGALDASRTIPPRAEGNPVQPIGSSAFHQAIAGLTPQQTAFPRRLPTIALPGTGARSIVNPYL